MNQRLVLWAFRWVRAKPSALHVKHMRKNIAGPVMQRTTPPTTRNVKKKARSKDWAFEFLGASPQA
jgi:hypothetical protein